jgi:hypothetical protein
VVVAEPEVRVVALVLARPRRPVGVEPVQPRLVLGETLVHECRERVLEVEAVGVGVERRARGHCRTAGIELALAASGDSPDDHFPGRGHVGLLRGVVPNQLAVGELHPDDLAIGVDAAGWQAAEALE